MCWMAKENVGLEKCTTVPHILLLDRQRRQRNLQQSLSHACRAQPSFSNTIRAGLKRRAGHDAPELGTSYARLDVPKGENTADTST